MLLDCTFRDGGYVNNWNFTNEQFSDWYSACNASGIDYAEIGFRRKPDASPKFGKWYYCPEDEMREVVIPLKSRTKIAIMGQLGTFDETDFLPKSESFIDMVRVLMAYHSPDKNDYHFDQKLFDEGLRIIRELHTLGYEVTFNIGRIDKVPEEILEKMLHLLSESPITAFYIADTYGNLDISSSKKILSFIRTHLSPHIKIGFHAHDNLCNATSKTLEMLSLSQEEGRPQLIDGTMFGYGRGSGNAKTELLISHFIRYSLREFHLLPVFEYIDKWISSFKTCPYGFGYNLMYIISAQHSMHVNYAVEMIEKHPDITIDKAFSVLHIIVEKNLHHYYDPKLISELI